MKTIISGSVLLSEALLHGVCLSRDRLLNGYYMVTSDAR